MQRILLSLVLGMLIGGFAVSLFLDARPTEPAAESGPREQRAAPVPALADATSLPERVAESRAPISGEDQPEGLFSAALRRYAEEGLRHGWKVVRKEEIPAADLAEGMKQFELKVLQTPHQVGLSLAEERTKEEAALADAKTGGVFNLLGSLDAGGVGPLPQIVRDPEQFGLLFQRTVGEHFRSGLDKRGPGGEPLEDGLTLTWPAGVFRVENLLQAKEKEKAPRDVTIAGAGMNSTMLVLTGALMARGDLRNFSIRDCTIYTNGNYLFDLRNLAASIQFDRARFVGFDTGAGGSCLLGTHSLALSARNCRIEGGYGRSPQHGSLFDVRTDALVARFEFCTLSLLNLEVGHIREGATVLFVGCSMDEILDDPETQAASRPGVMFDGCTIARHEGGWQNIPTLDLNTLFPDWQKRME